MWFEYFIVSPEQTNRLINRVIQSDAANQRHSTGLPERFAAFFLRQRDPANSLIRIVIIQFMCVSNAGAIVPIISPGRSLL